MSPQKPSADKLLKTIFANLEKQNTVARIWQKDHTVWKPEPQEIVNRLGWLDVADAMLPEADKIDAFVNDVRDAGYSDAVLLGMGGSSLAPEVMRQSFRARRGYLRLHVLDSTVPAWVRTVTRKIDPAKTLFIVSSKSGSTIEVTSFFKHFWNLVSQAKNQSAGENFIAITDPGTSLQRLAEERQFRHVFVNDPNIGGRYSAQSYFGMAPAALMGLDIRQILRRVQQMMQRCGESAPVRENTGAVLGAALGAMAQAGRDKVTFISSPSIASFGLWAEQLIAESTGKEQKGILPIAQEPFAPPKSYGDDRVFAYLRLDGDDNRASDRHARALEKAGQPVIHMTLADRYDIASEWFRWEFATAVVGAVIGIQPFDQPNVQESKDNTNRVLNEAKATGQIPATGTIGSLKELLGQWRDGDYVAIMSYLAGTPALDRALNELREKILKKYRLPNTMGYGPRFLHSTGQFHKGGPNSGIFVQFTADWGEDVTIPGEPYTFAGLAAAQCVGDYEALVNHRRRVARVHLGRNAAGGIRRLAESI